MYLAGYGIQTIANTLTAEGYPTVFGGDWHPYKVGAILDNEKYCGDLILQKTYRNNHIEKKTLPNRGELPQYFVQDDHKGIIDRDTFLMVQIEMARRKKKYGRKKEKTMIRMTQVGRFI